jgi:DNA invertase Pin-like site-specific DNA recombinase
VIGTSQDDADDRVLGGRQARGDRLGQAITAGIERAKAQGVKVGGGQASGERNSQAKLTEPQVQQIRRLYATDGTTQEALAQQFGVTQTTIGRILRGETWKT